MSNAASASVFLFLHLWSRHAVKHEKMWLWVTPGGLAEVAEHGWVPSVTSSLGKAAAALLCLGPCKSSCPAPLQHHLLPAAWFHPSKFWVLAHSPAVSDCSPAELTSRRLVGPYVPAAAPGTAGTRGKGCFPGDGAWWGKGGLVRAPSCISSTGRAAVGGCRQTWPEGDSYFRPFKLS